MFFVLLGEDSGLWSPRLYQLPPRGARVWVEEDIGQALLQGAFLLLLNPAAPVGAGGNRKQPEHCRERAIPTKGIKMGKSQRTDQCLELRREMNKEY